MAEEVRDLKGEGEKYEGIAETLTEKSELCFKTKRRSLFARAVFGLEAAGFDRARLSALGKEEPLRGCLEAADCAKERAHSPEASHNAVLMEDDTRQARVLFTSLTATIAAFIASGAALITGDGTAPVVAAAIAAGGGAGGVAGFLAGRAKHAHSKNLEHQVARCGQYIACD